MPSRSPRAAFASAAASDPFTAAARAMKLGKKLPGATYVHTSLLPKLPREVRDGVAVAAKIAGVRVGEFELLKLGTLEPRVSFLSYPGFDVEPFPALAESVTVDLAAATAKHMKYMQGEGTPILHRKETFIDPADPRVPVFAAITADLERRGLFRDTKRIGRRGTWNAMLRDAGVRVEGSRVIETRSNPSRSPGRAPRLNPTIGTSSKTIDGFYAAMFRAQVPRDQTVLATLAAVRLAMSAAEAAGVTGEIRGYDDVEALVSTIERHPAANTYDAEKGSNDLDERVRDEQRRLTRLAASIERRVDPYGSRKTSRAILETCPGGALTREERTTYVAYWLINAVSTIAQTAWYQRSEREVLTGFDFSGARWAAKMSADVLYGCGHTERIGASASVADVMVLRTVDGTLRAMDPKKPRGRARQSPRRSTKRSRS